MNSMLKYFSDSLAKDNIRFSIQDQQIHCLAHIINLSAQQVLQEFQEITQEEKEEDIEDIQYLSLITKVNNIILIF